MAYVEVKKARVPAKQCRVNCSRNICVAILRSVMPFYRHFTAA
jgi:hypothetical protein